MSTAFRIAMDNIQETPDTTSTATALGTVVFDSVTGTATYNITVTGLDFGDVLGIGDQTADPNDDVGGIHVHNADRNVNGAIVFGQFGPAQDSDDLVMGLNPDGSFTFSGTWEDSDPASTDISNFAGALGGATLGSDVPLYWNIHTTEFPAGAIRGQWVCIATDNGETVTGTSGDDILPGLGGNDVINGLAGNDTLDGGTGNDRLNGGSGIDDMSGGTGNDVYSVNHGDDNVVEAAAAGTDTVRSTVSHALGNNVERLVLIGSGNLFGTGNGLANKIVGNGGANRLKGGGANDQLVGQNGNDTLIGGAGRDVLLGGGDNDIFVFTRLTDSGVTNATADRLRDFATGDKVHLSAIDANAGVDGNQAFVLDTGGAFAAGEIRQVASGSNLRVLLNVDADTAAEMTFLVIGTTTPLAEADFVL